MTSANRLIVSILVVAAAAVAFWVLALSPKRETADELSSQVSQLEVSLAEAQGRVREGENARREFPVDYRQLVLLGQAVPASDETASLLVELNHIARSSRVKFESISLSSSSEGGTASAAAPPAPPPTAPEGSSAEPSAVPAAATIPPTEAAASLLPLGATIGPAGLGVMPYTLTFSGDFFHVADFIKGIDSLVRTGTKMSVDGRLITLNGFALSPDPERGFPYLDATFSVTAYLTPPSQGLTAGASPAAPAPSTATPAAETSGPEGSSETSQAPNSSETVSAR
jgi:Tfp pilus assembly protein PilO